jgi:chromosome segregation ATPase
MTRTRNKRTVAEAAAQDEGQGDAPAPETVSEHETVPADLAAAAIEDREAAESAAELATQRRAEAEAVVSAARADADERIRRGHADALPLIADANALERKAAALGDRSQRHKEAASREALTERHEAKAADLTAELERVTETLAGLDNRLAELGTDRERLEAERAAARTAGAARTIARLVPQLEGIDEAMADLAGQRERAQARVVQIGGTSSGELLDALTAAETHRRAFTLALDELYPDRPGAEHRRTLAALKGALEGNLARIAEEAKAAPPRRRSVLDGTR